jgi:hypothetical protein
MGMILLIRAYIIVAFVSLLTANSPIAFGKNKMDAPELRDEFINNPLKKSGKLISPMYYSFVKQQVDGTFKIIPNSKLGNKSSCFLQEANLRSTLYNYKFYSKGSLILPTTLPELRKILYESARVELMIVEKTKETGNDSMDIMLWGKSNPVFLYENESYDREAGFNNFCTKLGYNGVVIGQEGKTAYLINSNYKFKEKEQVSVISDQSSNVFLNQTKKSKASAVLQYNHTNSAGVHVFDVIIGKAKAWDKVLIKSEATN